MQKYYLEYVWEKDTSVPTFNSAKEKVSKWDVFECSKRNFNTTKRLYPRLFKVWTKEEPKLRKWWDKAKKKVEVKKEITKPLSKKSK